MTALALLALLAVGGDEEILDVGALTRLPPAASRAPILGCRPLESGGGGFGEDVDGPEEAADPDRVLDALDEVGLLWPYPESVRGGRWLVVPADRAAGVRAALASLAADVLRTVQVRVEVTFPDGAVETAVVSARDGRWVARAASRRRRFQHDNDVEIACSNSAEGAPSCVADPLSFTVREGLAVDVRPFLLGDGEAVAIEAVIQAGRFEEETPDLPLECRFHGRIQMPRYRGFVAAVSGRVAPGKDLTLRLVGEDGPYVVRIVPAVEGKPGTGRCRRPSRAILRAVGASLPFRPIDDFFRIRGKRVVGMLRGVHGGTEVEAAGNATEVLTRAIRVDLRLLAGEEEIGRTELSALDGWTAAARIGRERMILVDWDVEVGCYNRIGDPIVQPAFAGDLVRLRPRLSPDGRFVLLDLAYRRHETIVLPPPPSGMTSSGPTHPVRLTERVVETDLVLERSGDVRVPLGRAADGRPLVLVVSTRGP